MLDDAYGRTVAIQLEALEAQCRREGPGQSHCAGQAAPVDSELGVTSEPPKTQPSRWANPQRNTNTARPGFGALVNTQYDYTLDSVTPHAVTATLKGVTDCEVALSTWQRAVAVGKADMAVYVTVAQICGRCGRDREAHEILEEAFRQSLPMAPQCLSVIVSICLHQLLRECARDGPVAERRKEGVLGGDERDMDSKGNGRWVDDYGGGFVAEGAGDGGHPVETAEASDPVRLLTRYLGITRERRPALLAASVCQRVVRDLVQAGRVGEAMRIHLDFFRDKTCKTDVLTTVFDQACHLAASKPTASEQREVAELAIDLFCNYLYADQVLKWKLLRTEHFNRILYLMSLSGSTENLEPIVTAMIHRTHVFLDKYNDLLESSSPRGASQPAAPGSSAAAWHPSTFTVAETIRLCRLRPESLHLIVPVISWAIREGVYLPRAVIGQAIDLLYR